MANERISTQTVLRGPVRKEAAWRIISDFGMYPTLTRTIEKVIVHERTERAGRSEWFVFLEDAPLRWLEKDYFDAANYSMQFESIDGDFEKISGAWKVEDYNGEGIALDYSLDYSLGIPVIEDVVGAIFKEKMKNNIDSMVQSIAAAISGASAVEERKSPRIPLNVFNTILVNGKETRLRIVNIGTGGMIFHYSPGSLPPETVFTIDDMVLKADVASDNQRAGKMRAIFRSEISREDVDRIARYLTTKNIRMHERKALNKTGVLTSGKKSATVTLVDISRGGMLVRHSGPLETGDAEVTIDGIAVTFQKKMHDADNKTLRVQFAQTLREEDLSDFLAKPDGAKILPIEMKMA
jgi:ribosome-associated toxin RatA of RatAB toxin-antitoxin module